ncbi:MAG: copper chaperone PCu(A)C [Rickettsiaceae bacterium]|nr:copper chaperone PCu(A)C [Rickettsiaceae bacterium]
MKNYLAIIIALVTTVTANTTSVALAAEKTQQQITSERKTDTQTIPETKNPKEKTCHEDHEHDHDFCCHEEEDKLQHESKQEHKVIASEKINCQGAWIRSTSKKSTNAAGYFTITNNSDIDIKIDQITSDIVFCDKIEIHGYRTDSKNVKRMYKLKSVAVPAGETVEFKPGSFHIMFKNLSDEIKKNTHLDLNILVSPADAEKNVKIESVKLKFEIK